MKKYAKCKVCEEKGVVNGFHVVSIDEEEGLVEITCSTCGNLVAKLYLHKEEKNENKIRAGTF